MNKSEGCAIGRKVSRKAALKLDKVGRNVCIIFNMLPSKLRGLKVDFLKRIQYLHDESSFWDKNGLSEKGLKWVETIKRIYELI